MANVYIWKVVRGIPVHKNGHGQKLIFLNSSSSKTAIIKEEICDEGLLHFKNLGFASFICDTIFSVITSIFFILFLHTKTIGFQSVESFYHSKKSSSIVMNRFLFVFFSLKIINRTVVVEECIKT